MYPPVTFNNNAITKCPHQKHLGLVFDSKLDFIIHIEQKIKKCNKIIGLSISLPRRTFYRSYVRPHLDYSDILYDKPENQNFENKLEKVLHKVFLTITAAIQGTSRLRLYDELGLISLSNRRWYNKLIFFYKIVNVLLPDYLQSYTEVLPQDNYNLRSVSAGNLKPLPS